MWLDSGNITICNLLLDSDKLKNFKATQTLNKSVLGVAQSSYISIMYIYVWNNTLGIYYSKEYYDWK
jgi:phosphatidate phosphatase PAH1